MASLLTSVESIHAFLIIIFFSKSMFRADDQGLIELNLLVGFLFDFFV